MKNNPRKQNIIEAARKLFYAEGYSNTSMEAIAGSCGIQKQLITYYFGTKEALGNAVSSQYNTEQREKFDLAGEKLGISDPLITNSAFFLWQSRYYKEDENARRFFNEMLTTGEPTIGPLEDEFQRTMPEGSKLDSPRFYRFVTSYYGASWFMYHFCRGEIDIRPVEFEREYLFLLLSTLVPDEKQRNIIYQGARTFLDNLIITELPDFEIRVEVKPDRTLKK